MGAKIGELIDTLRVMPGLVPGIHVGKFNEWTRNSLECAAERLLVIGI
jgi:hypothetical protein